jgi:hypothetical protein
MKNPDNFKICSKIIGISYNTKEKLKIPAARPITALKTDKQPRQINFEKGK